MGSRKEEGKGLTSLQLLVLCDCCLHFGLCVCGRGDQEGSRGVGRGEVQCGVQQCNTGCFFRARCLALARYRSIGSNPELTPRRTHITQKNWEEVHIHTQQHTAHQHTLHTVSSTFPFSSSFFTFSPTTSLLAPTHHHRLSNHVRSTHRPPTATNGS